MELKSLLVEGAVLQTGVVGCGGLDVAPAVPYPSLGTSVSCIHSTPLSQGSGGQSFLQQRLQQDVGEEWVNTSPPIISSASRGLLLLQNKTISNL